MSLPCCFELLESARDKLAPKARQKGSMLIEWLRFGWTPTQTGNNLAHSLTTLSSRKVNLKTLI